MTAKTRRSYGEGELRTRIRNGKTYHIARISRVEHGRRRTREVWCKDPTAARKALKKLKIQRAQGKQVFGERTLLVSWLSTWHDKRIPTVSPQTTMDYGRVLRLHMKPFLGRITLADFSSDDASDLYDYLRRRKRTSATIKQVHKVLHKALEDAVRAGIVDRNPLSKLDAPAHRYREVEPYSLEELQRFLAFAHGDRLEALWVLAVFSQAREGELFALRWRDVELDAATISVTRSLQDVSPRERRIGGTKTAGSRRRIDLPPLAVQSLRMALERAQERAGFSEAELVFHDRRGGPLRRQNVLRRNLYPLMDRAELRRVHFHALRHSGATLLASLIPLVALKERLGHASIATTANVYVHRSPSLQRIAADRLAELFPTFPKADAGSDQAVRLTPKSSTAETRKGSKDLTKSRKSAS